MSRILVIQLKRIGDFVLTAPAMQALRDSMPEAEIVMLVPDAVAALARCLTSVSRVIPYTRGRINLETWGSAMAGEWTACLDYTGTDRSAIIAQLSRAGHRIGYTKFARGLRKLAYTATSEASVRDLHTVDFHLALVSQLLGREMAPPAASEHIFHLSPEIVDSARSKLAAGRTATPYVILHPGTAREEKFWPAERWVEVGRHLGRHHNLHLVLTGSDDGLERPHLDYLRRHLDVPFTDLTGKLSLPELASVIDGSRAVAGVDSMAMHVASLFGKPQVALFGPTNPYHWRARHDRSLVVVPGSETPVKSFVPKMKKGAMSGIPVTRVTAALDALIG